MSLNDGTLEEIKSRVDIVDLISDYLSLKKSGQNWKGLCPFHTEKTPSFTVSPAKQIYHCFGCGSGGDIFSFLLKYENLTFPEALGTLAKRAGVTLKEFKKSTTKAGEKETLLSMHKDALSFFMQSLKKNPGAVEYLKRRRIDYRTQELFSLGYAPKSWDSLMKFLQKKGYKAETINKAGLLVRGQKGFYDTFRDRIIFPINDLKGDVVAFGGRTINGSEPKYLNSPETIIFNKGKVLYGLNFARDSIKKTGYALFVEGYMDVIAVSSNGFPNTVASMGTALTPEHGKLIKRFTENAILAFDSDASGIRAAKSAAGILLESGINVKVIVFPGEDDPDSFLGNNGKEAFAKLLKHPLSIVDFLTMQDRDKHLLAREVLEVIAKVPNKVLQGVYIKALSEKLNVGESYVMEEFQSIRKQPGAGIRKTSSKALPGQDKKPMDEVYVIKLLLQLPDKAEDISGSISEGHFGYAPAREVFKKIKGGSADLNELLSKCDSREKDFVTETSLLDDFDDPNKAIRDCVKRLKSNRRSILSYELQRRIKEAEDKKDITLLRRLQSEHCEILKSKGD